MWDVQTGELTHISHSGKKKFLRKSHRKDLTQSRNLHSSEAVSELHCVTLKSEERAEYSAENNTVIWKLSVMICTLNFSEAIAEEKGEAPPEDTIECTVDVQIDAHIPETYIESLNQRLDIYKKIATVKTEEDKSDIIDELIDRYGEPPKSVTGLLKVAMLRNTAIELGITEITQRNGCLVFYTVLVTAQQLLDLSDSFNGRVSFTEIKKPNVSVRIEKNENPVKLMEKVLSIMLETKHREAKQLPQKN